MGSGGVEKPHKKYDIKWNFIEESKDFTNIFLAIYWCVQTLDLNSYNKGGSLFIEMLYLYFVNIH